MTLSEFQIQGVCEWCKQESGELRPIRDWEEALTGPEHLVCPECAGKEREGFDVATAEWAAYMEERMADGSGFEDHDSEEGWFFGDVRARVCWPTYRHAQRLVPALRVRLTEPLRELPVGTRLTLRLNDYEGRGRWRVRWRWRLMLPGTRVVASDGQLGEEGEVLREGSELWVLYLDKEQ